MPPLKKNNARYDFTLPAKLKIEFTGKYGKSANSVIRNFMEASVVGFVVGITLSNNLWEKFLKKTAQNAQDPIKLIELWIKNYVESGESKNED